MEYKTMVVCSTQNQMVNYLAIMEHGIKNVINITLNEIENINLKKFNYKKWDDALKKSIDKKCVIEPINFGHNEIKEHGSIITQLNILLKSKLIEMNLNMNEPILWNITGGQRHIVMAITQYVNSYRRESDLLVYFDGDKEEYYYYNENKGKEQIKAYNSNKDFKMNIPVAFQLMGIELNKKNENKPDYYDYLINDDNERIRKQSSLYLEILKTYLKEPMLGKLLIESNKDNIDRFESFKQKFKEANIDSNIDLDYLAEDLSSYSNGYFFGYILEKMAFLKILEVINSNNVYKNKVADIDISVKTKGNNGNNTNDELDIVLLTKKGKVIVFECKSGKMTGDNAKSTSYTTYRLSGVYGTPVLITPLTVQLLTKYKSSNLLKNIESAQNAAEKAELIICTLDQCNVSNNKTYSLEEYIREVLK